MVKHVCSVKRTLRQTYRPAQELKQACRRGLRIVEVEILLQPGEALLAKLHVDTRGNQRVLRPSCKSQTFSLGQANVNVISQK